MSDKVIIGSTFLGTGVGSLRCGAVLDRVVGASAKSSSSSSLSSAVSPSTPFPLRLPLRLEVEVDGPPFNSAESRSGFWVDGDRCAASSVVLDKVVAVGTDLYSSCAGLNQHRNQRYPGDYLRGTLSSSDQGETSHLGNKS
jgi:hypothetical protein